MNNHIQVDLPVPCTGRFADIDAAQTRDTANTSHPQDEERQGPTAEPARGPHLHRSSESPSLEPKRRGENPWGRHRGRRGHRGWHPGT